MCIVYCTPDRSFVDSVFTDLNMYPHTVTVSRISHAAGWLGITHYEQHDVWQ